MAKPNRFETDSEKEGVQFNAETILAEKEKQEEQLRKNAALVPDALYEQSGISIVSGPAKITARPKSGELTFEPPLTPEQKAKGEAPRKIKYKNTNAVIVTGNGKPAGKPGQVRVELLPLDFLRLIQNAMNDKKFVSMLNLMADEERAKAVSTENWKAPEA